MRFATTPANYGYYHLGVELYHNGSYAAADQALSAAIQQQQYVAEAYYFLAESLRKQGQPTHARYAAEAALLAGTVFGAEALQLLVELEQEQHRSRSRNPLHLLQSLF
jgi:uncharacterized protein HemY